MRTPLGNILFSVTEFMALTCGSVLAINISLVIVLDSLCEAMQGKSQLLFLFLEILHSSSYLWMKLQQYRPSVKPKCIYSKLQTESMRNRLTIYLVEKQMHKNNVLWERLETTVQKIVPSSSGRQHTFTAAGEENPLWSLVLLGFHNNSPKEQEVKKKETGFNIWGKYKT